MALFGKEEKTQQTPQVKTPWIKNLGNVPAHLEYFQGSMYDKVAEVARNYPNNIAYDFMGGKVRYKDFINKVDNCARALAANPEVILFDEPTSALNQEETEKLFAIIRKLRSEGKGIIYISHKLDEVFAVADRVQVLRNGESVYEGKVAETTREQIISSMCGPLLMRGKYMMNLILMLVKCIIYIKYSTSRISEYCINSLLF